MSETQALIQHEDSPTAIVSRKLRTLMQYNAIKQGYLPSTTQIEEHLAAVIQSPLLNSRQRGLSRQTKVVLDDTRSFVKALGLLVKEKNENDLVQEIIWNLRGASVDSEMSGDMFTARLDAATARADAKTAHMKAKAIADVLYSNPQFRALIHDGSILARDVLSDVVEATATAIAPEESDLIDLEQEATDVDGRAIRDDVEDTKMKLNEGIESAKDKVRETYDQATTAALDTIRDLQAKGQVFGEQLTDQAAQTAGDLKETAEQVLDKGRAATEGINERISGTVNEAIAKLEEVTGIQASDIKERLNKGISVDEIIASAKVAGQKATEKIHDAAYQADQAGGRALNSAKAATSNFVDRNKVQEKVDSAVKEGQSTIAKTKASSQNAVSKAQSKGKQVAEDAKPQIESATKKAGETLNTVQQGARDVKDQAESKTREASNSASNQASDSTDSATSGENHLREIGIIHTEPATSDPSSETTKATTGGASDRDASQLLQNVTERIKEQIEGVQGITQEQLEDAARDLIDRSTQIADDLKQTVKKTSKSAKEQISQSSQNAGKRAENLKEQGQAKGIEAANAAKDATNTAATKIDSFAQDASEQSAAIAEQAKNLDTSEFQDAINNLLQTAKQRLEESTGVKADDARQSIDWAIKRGEELAEQAMQKGRQGTQEAVQKSGEAMQLVKEKTKEIGSAAQDSAVSVGAQAQHVLQNAPKDAAGQIHDTLDATQELVDNTIVALQESTSEIREYLGKKFPPKRRQAIQKHFQGLAVALRDNSDYSNGLDGLISIGKKYVDYTLTFTEELPSDAGEVVSTNAELDNAVRLTLQLLERFSGGVGFNGIQQAYIKLKKDMKKEKGSEDFFGDCMTFFKKIVQDMKYASSTDAEKHGQQLLTRIDEFSEDTGFKQDLNNIVREVVRLAEGFSNDKVLFNVISKGRTCFKHLVMNEYGNFVFKRRVMKDFFNIILPSALKLVQYVPISRIEFQDADVDVLIENLVFESSASHDQSFLPYRLKIDNHNQIEFLNAYKFESDYSNELTVKLQGLTLAVRDAGFYIRKKTGFFRFSDSGLVDLIMDGPGIDIDIDLAMSTDVEENDVTKDALFIVKDVRVHIRKLDFSTSGTKHGWLIGLVKPFIRGYIKRQIGLAVGAAIKDQLTYYEYQLRMLQHRIKTAYIANNGQASYESFFRAIFTANAGGNSGRKGQFEVVVGGQGPLAGVFTKASLQHELEEADAIAHEHGQNHSWKNDIFDL